MEFKKWECFIEIKEKKKKEGKKERKKERTKIYLKRSRFIENKITKKGERITVKSLGGRNVGKERREEEEEEEREKERERERERVFVNKKGKKNILEVTTRTKILERCQE